MAQQELLMVVVSPFNFFFMITYKYRGGDLSSVRKQGISTVPPGDPWSCLGGRSAPPSWIVQASILTSVFPSFSSKQRATRVSQHAEIQGCLEEPAGSEDQSLEQSVSQEPQYLCVSHCLPSEIHIFTCHNILE